MTTPSEYEINVFLALDFIRDHAPEYAQAKAERVYLEQFRKTCKALGMRDAELAGHKSAVVQEREAYAQPAYMQVLEGLKAAVENEERLRWRMVAAQAKIEVWRTLESTRRIEAKTV